MDLDLVGRRALLIGAGRGLGGAAAMAMAREGASVAVVARTREAVEERARACRAAGAPEAFGVVADATDAAHLARAIRESAAALGGLDILVTLVGGSLLGGTELEDSGWELALGRNLWPAIRSTRLALPLLEASARGRGVAEPASVDAPGSRQQSVVLHVASIWGREGGGLMSYNAAKSAHQPGPWAGARAGAARRARALDRTRQRPSRRRFLGGPPATGPARNGGVRPPGDPPSAASARPRRLVRSSPFSRALAPVGSPAPASWSTAASRGRFRGAAGPPAFGGHQR